MIKKTFVAFGILVLVAAVCLYWYFRPLSPSSKPSDTLSAVPVNAVFIIECRQLSLLRHKLQQSEKLWDGLMSLSDLNNLNGQLHTTDSLLAMHPELSAYKDSISILISAHPEGINTYSFLFTLGLPKTLNPEDIRRFFEKTAETGNVTKRLYDGVTISGLTVMGTKMNYLLRGNTLLISGSPMLIEDAIRQLNIHQSLFNNTVFERLLKSKSPSGNLTFYLNLKTIPGFLEHASTESKKVLIRSVRNFSDWIVVDGDFANNSISLSGFSASADTVSNYLNLFRGQTSQRLGMARIMPENTCFFLAYGISNFKTFYNSYKNYLEGQHSFFEYEKNKVELSKTYHVDIHRQFLDLLEKEMGVFIRPLPDKKGAYSSFAVFRASEINTAFNVIRSASDSSAAYLNYSIFHFPVPGFLSMIFGQPFESFSGNYFTKIDNYLVFSNSKEELKNVIADYENGRTLENSKAFNTASENFSAESNLFVYSTLRKSPGLVQDFFPIHALQESEDNLKILKKFDFFALQFSSAPGCFYTNACLKYYSDTSQTQEPLWETQLDTNLDYGPVALKDQLSGNPELLVQDKKHTIYMLDQSGSILWKKHLPEKISGSVVQIDAKNNNRLQILFNTRSAVYLIDRKGNPVDHFPIHLKSPACNGLSILNLKKNKECRILVACENKSLYQFHTNGEPCKDWKPEKTENRIRLPAQFIHEEGKDYILLVDELGKVYGLNPQGKEELNLKATFSGPVTGFRIECEGTEKINKLMACDSLGKIEILTLANVKTELKFLEFEGPPLFSYCPAQQHSRPMCCFIQNRKLVVFSADKNQTTGFEQAFAFEFRDSIKQAAQLIQLNDSTIDIGVTSGSANELYLFRNDGSLEKGFPCQGQSSFIILRNSADARQELVCGSGDLIRAYGFPF